MDRVIRNNPLATRLSMLWIGLGLYTLAYSQTDIVMLGLIGNLLNHLVPIGALLIFVSLFGSIRPTQIERTRTAWVMIGILLVWHIFMVLRLDPEDTLALINYSDPYSYTAYLFAIVLLIPPIPMVQSYLNIARWLILTGMPIMLMPLLYYAGNGAIQFAFEGYLAAAGLIVMTNKYHTRQWLWIAYIGLFVAFMVSTITARRGLMATTMLYMLCGAYMAIFKGRKISHSTQILLVLTGISVALIGAGIFLLESNGLFAEIAGRAGDNTREYVFLLFFWDMLQTPLDMIFGRGIRGGYQCAGVDENGEGIRMAVENGVLQMMLKGGIIYALIVLTILIYAMRKAWHSKNQLSWASILIVAVQLFDMLPFGVHACNTKTFIIWMCVSICLCPSLCDKSDEEILELIAEKKHKLPKWEEL